MEGRGLFRRYVWLIRLFFITLSTLLIVLGAILPTNSVVNPVLAGLGISLLAGTLSTTFQAVFGIEPPGVTDLLRVRERFVDRGLDAIHLHRGEFEGETRFPSLATAHTLDMMFNSGRYTMSADGVNVRTALDKHGCRVRLLLSNPDNPVFSHTEISQGLSLTATSIPHEIQDTIFELQEAAKQLKNRSASIEIRLAPCIMTASMIIVDNKYLRLTPYLPYTHSANVPLFDITVGRDGRLFDAYRAVFERAWEKSVEIRMVLYPESNEK